MDERPPDVVRGHGRHSPGGLGWRVLLASTALVLIVAIALALLIRTIFDLRDAGRLARETREELIALDAVQTLVVDLETGLRGFVITGEDRFLQPWNEARRRLPDEIDRLESLLRQDPELGARVRAIAASIDSYVRDYGAPLIASVHRGEPTAASVAVTAEGKTRVDALRRQIDAVRAGERAAITRRQEQADTASERAVVAGIAALAGSVALLVLFAVYLMRVVVAPVRRAARMADRVTEGDLTARLPPTSVGEIGDLERSFNVMTESLEANRQELEALLAEQAALRRVATLVASGAPPDEVFSAVAEEAAKRLGAGVTMVLRYEPDGSATVVGSWTAVELEIPLEARLAVEGGGVAGTVSRTGTAANGTVVGGEPGSVAGRLAAFGSRSAVAAPIVVEGQLWGAAIAGLPSQAAAASGTETQLSGFTELAAMAIANAESRAQLVASRARVVAAADESRRRIERDLHDGAQQRLVALALRLRAAAAALPESLSETRRDLQRVGSELDGVLEELRELSRGLHPAILSEGGLAPALRTLARRSPLPVTLDVGELGRVEERIEVAAYFVVSEALANAAKHARASGVEVRVSVDGDQLRLSIHDDGVGGADPAHGSGLIGLRDRVEAVGGRIALTSPAGEGTTLVVELPL